MSTLGAIVRHRLFWPVVAIFMLIAAAAIVQPTSMEITVRDGNLYGGPISILRYTSVLLLVALGMTLVIATRGIDLSVGAVIAITGAIAVTQIVNSDNPGSPATVAGAIVTAMMIALFIGLFNGFMVSVVGLQPIIATLVLMMAGRGVAMLVTGAVPVPLRDSSPAYRSLASGFTLGVPNATLIAAFVFAAMVLLTRRTALGMLIESVGINPTASRLAGVQSRSITWMVYVLCALFAGLAGILQSADSGAADPANAGMFIEMDAILAVVIGGTSLAGGKFNLGGTLVGALLLTALTRTIIPLGVPPTAVSLFKAIIVVAICLLQSPVAQARLEARRRRVAATATAEVPA